jgi:4-amino-4-deoxy-L-arabinose transferase-like glycosyltransferase
MTARRRTAMGVGVVTALALVRGFLLAGLVPPLQGPDEPAHFDNAQRLAEHGRLPEPRRPCDGFSAETRAAERALLDPIKFRPTRPLPPLNSFAAPDPSDPRSRATSGCGPAASYPPLYYVTAAAAYRLAGDGTFFERLFAARLASVAWGALAVAFAFLLGTWWFGRRRDGTMIAVLFLAHPMMAFLSSVVTNDAALFAACTGAFAAIAAAMRFERKQPALFLLAACTTAGALTKPTLLILLPVFGACAVAAFGWRRRSTWLRVAAALAPAAVVSVAWSASAGTPFDGAVPRPVDVQKFVATFVLDADRLYAVWWKFFWSSWGWLDANLHPSYYLALAAAVLLSVVGAALSWRTLRPKERGAIAFGAGATAYTMIVLHVMEINVFRLSGSGLIQGRYLLSLFGLQAVALVTGMRGLARAVRTTTDGAWVFAGVLLVTQAAAMTRTLTRYFS